MQKQVPYSEAKATKYPEPLAIVMAKDREGKVNPIPVGWIMTASNEPPMLAIAVGKTRYSAETITHSRSFTVAYPSEAMQPLVLAFGSASGRDVDKLEEAACATQPALEIDGLLLTDAVANFECELESYMPAGDHMIFVGRVVAAHVTDLPLDRLYTVGPDHTMGGVVPK
jgi:flavin reductase (DIM6/NTAB) family NADH-FMN oxidoreductase RutF